MDLETYVQSLINHSQTYISKAQVQRIMSHHVPSYSLHTKEIEGATTPSVGNVKILTPYAGNGFGMVCSPTAGGNIVTLPLRSKGNAVVALGKTFVDDDEVPKHQAGDFLIEHETHSKLLFQISQPPMGSDGIRNGDLLKAKTIAPTTKVERTFEVELIEKDLLPPLRDREMVYVYYGLKSTSMHETPAKATEGYGPGGALYAWKSVVSVTEETATVSISTNTMDFPGVVFDYSDMTALPDANFVLMRVSPMKGFAMLAHYTGSSLHFDEAPDYKTLYIKDKYPRLVRYNRNAVLGEEVVVNTKDDEAYVLSRHLPKGNLVLKHYTYSGLKIAEEEPQIYGSKLKMELNLTPNKPIGVGMPLENITAPMPSAQILMEDLTQSDIDVATRMAFRHLTSAVFDEEACETDYTLEPLPQKEAGHFGVDHVNKEEIALEGSGIFIRDYLRKYNKEKKGWRFVSLTEAEEYYEENRNKYYDNIDGYEIDEFERIVPASGRRDVLLREKDIEEEENTEQGENEPDIHDVRLASYDETIDAKGKLVVNDKKTRNDDNKELIGQKGYTYKTQSKDSPVLEKTFEDGYLCFPKGDIGLRHYTRSGVEIRELEPNLDYHALQAAFSLFAWDNGQYYQPYHSTDEDRNFRNMKFGPYPLPLGQLLIENAKFVSSPAESSQPTAEAIENENEDAAEKATEETTATEAAEQPEETQIPATESVEKQLAGISAPAKQSAGDLMRKTAEAMKKSFEKDLGGDSLQKVADALKNASASTPSAMLPPGKATNAFDNIADSIEKNLKETVAAKAPSLPKLVDLSQNNNDPLPEAIKPATGLRVLMQKDGVGVWQDLPIDNKPLAYTYNLPDIDQFFDPQSGVVDLNKLGIRVNSGHSSPNTKGSVYVETITDLRQLLKPQDRMDREIFIGGEEVDSLVKRQFVKMGDFKFEGNNQYATIENFEPGNIKSSRDKDWIAKFYNFTGVRYSGKVKVVIHPGEVTTTSFYTGIETGNSEAEYKLLMFTDTIGDTINTLAYGDTKLATLISVYFKLLKSALSEAGQARWEYMWDNIPTNPEIEAFVARYSKIADKLWGNKEDDIRQAAKKIQKQWDDAKISTELTTSALAEAQALADIRRLIDIQPLLVELLLNFSDSLKSTGAVVYQGKTTKVFEAAPTSPVSTTPTNNTYITGIDSLFLNSTGAETAEPESANEAEEAERATDKNVIFPTPLLPHTVHPQPDIWEEGADTNRTTLALPGETATWVGLYQHSSHIQTVGAQVDLSENRIGSRLLFRDYVMRAEPDDMDSHLIAAAKWENERGSKHNLIAPKGSVELHHYTHSGLTIADTRPHYLNKCGGGHAMSMRMEMRSLDFLSGLKEDTEEEKLEKAMSDLAQTSRSAIKALGLETLAKAMPNGKTHTAKPVPLFEKPDGAFFCEILSNELVDQGDKYTIEKITKDERFVDEKDSVRGKLPEMPHGKRGARIGFTHDTTRTEPYDIPSHIWFEDYIVAIEKESDEPDGVLQPTHLYDALEKGETRKLLMPRGYAAFELYNKSGLTFGDSVTDINISPEELDTLERGRYQKAFTVLTLQEWNNMKIEDGQNTPAMPFNKSSAMLSMSCIADEANVAGKDATQVLLVQQSTQIDGELGTALLFEDFIQESSSEHKLPCHGYKEDDSDAKERLPLTFPKGKLALQAYNRSGLFIEDLCPQELKEQQVSLKLAMQEWNNAEPDKSGNPFGEDSAYLLMEELTPKATEKGKRASVVKLEALTSKGSGADYGSRLFFEDYIQEDMPAHIYEEEDGEGKAMAPLFPKGGAIFQHYTGSGLYITEEELAEENHKPTVLLRLRRWEDDSPQPDDVARFFAETTTTPKEEEATNIGFMHVASDSACFIRDINNEADVNQMICEVNHWGNIVGVKGEGSFLRFEDLIPDGQAKQVMIRLHHIEDSELRFEQLNLASATKPSDMYVQLTHQNTSRLVMEDHVDAGTFEFPKGAVHLSHYTNSGLFINDAELAQENHAPYVRLDLKTWDKRTDEAVARFFAEVSSTQRAEEAIRIGFAHVSSDSSFYIQDVNNDMNKKQIISGISHWGNIVGVKGEPSFLKFEDLTSDGEAKQVMIRLHHIEDSELRFEQLNLASATKPSDMYVQLTHQNTSRLVMEDHVDAGTFEFPKGAVHLSHYTNSGLFINDAELAQENHAPYVRLDLKTWDKRTDEAAARFFAEVSSTQKTDEAIRIGFAHVGADSAFFIQDVNNDISKKQIISGITHWGNIVRSDGEPSCLKFEDLTSNGEAEQVKVILRHIAGCKLKFEQLNIADKPNMELDLHHTKDAGFKIVNMEDDTTLTIYHPKGAEIKIDPEGNVSVFAPKNITMQAAETITLEAGNVDIVAETKIDGNLHVTGTITAPDGSWHYPQ